MPALLSIAVPAIGAINASAAGAGAMVAVPIGFEMLAIVVSSISGALTAREKRLDLVGAIALAVLCSLGGGLIRDVILQVGSVYIISQPLALPASMITAAVVFVIPSFVERQDRLIAVLDIFGVGLFAATGADKAYAYGFEPIICVMMGFFTAVGGGMLRDICLARHLPAQQLLRGRRRRRGHRLRGPRELRRLPYHLADRMRRGHDDPALPVTALRYQEPHRCGDRRGHP